MTKYITSGNVAVVVEDSGGGNRTLTPYVDEIDGLEKLYDALDTTQLGDTAEISQVGVQKKATITIRGHYDNAATTGPHVVFKGIVGYTTSRTVTITLEGANTFTLEVFCTAYRIIARSKEIVRYEAVLETTGAITIA